MKKLLTLFFFLISFTGYTQSIDANCDSIIGWGYDDSCVASVFSPTLVAGNTYTKCFYYKPTAQGAHLSILYVTGNCGPIALYNNLSYAMYNSTCDSVVSSGTIYPVASNTFVNWLDTSQTYIICYTFHVLCNLSDGCPSINPSYLGLDWVKFTGEFDRKENYILLKWQTANEENINYFIIEKLDEVYLWRNIGIAFAKNKMNNFYNFKDRKYREINFYRIKQVDYNGNSSYSKTIIVEVPIFYTDCQYFTILGIPMEGEFESFPLGVYIRRCGNLAELAPKIE